ncbi:uncharacterized protein EI97DRAFT_212790 [Westerdykella ornata]|uniref:Uncharacterized protein n=1 Tax=Westerdykella ornata TaxID=318751 RepID=A0A6A6J727_WESOR|nr:uncharacterized protein EI97DRAFT_212790 [Westerdykella ornata]KAF2272381.1 hypothetical protein EI97DRAFT_212790 [Westerdykella ornata]
MEGETGRTHLQASFASYLTDPSRASHQSSYLLFLILVYACTQASFMTNDHSRTLLKNHNYKSTYQFKQYPSKTTNQVPPHQTSKNIISNTYPEGRGKTKRRRNSTPMLHPCRQRRARVTRCCAVCGIRREWPFRFLCILCTLLVQQRRNLCSSTKEEIYTPPSKATK